MKKILIITGVIISLIYISKINEKLIIPENSIRIRVIANSNKIEDQVLKLKIKKELEDSLYKKLSNVENIDEARIKIKKSIPTLKENVWNRI